MTETVSAAVSKLELNLNLRAKFYQVFPRMLRLGIHLDGNIQFCSFVQQTVKKFVRRIGVIREAAAKAIAVQKFEAFSFGDFFVFGLCNMQNVSDAFLCCPCVSAAITATPQICISR